MDSELHIMDYDTSWLVLPKKKQGLDAKRQRDFSEYFLS